MHLCFRCHDCRCCWGMCRALFPSETLNRKRFQSLLRRQLFRTGRSCCRQSLESYILFRYSYHCTFYHQLSSCFIWAQMTVILSHREGRASLASVAHRTHFQTLSNVARNGSAWPDNTDGANPSKVPDLPVRRRHSPVLARHRKPSFTFFFLSVGILTTQGHLERPRC